MQGKYYVEIITPGALVGLIVGYAAQKHGITQDSQLKTHNSRLITNIYSRLSWRYGKM